MSASQQALVICVVNEWQKVVFEIDFSANEISCTIASSYAASPRFTQPDVCCNV